LLRIVTIAIDNIRAAGAIVVDRVILLRGWFAIEGILDVASPADSPIVLGRSRQQAQLANR